MIELREASDNELAEAAALMVAAYEEYSSALRPAAWAAYAHDIADVRSRLADSKLLLAFDGESVLGAVTYYPQKQQGTGEGWPPGWAGVRLLAVSPEARGRGLGRLLMEECVRRAQAEGAHTMGLHTTELMAVAGAMYERMGFERAPEFDFHPTPTFTVMAYRLSLGV